MCPRPDPLPGLLTSLSLLCGTQLNGFIPGSSECGGTEERGVNPPTLLSVPHIPQVQSRLG